MALEAWRFGNPETVCLAQEARTCKGCQHETFIKFDGNQKAAVCMKYKEHSDYGGKRCKFYRERL